MIKRTVLCLIIGVGFMAAACGDDLGDKAASDLTAEERTEVCEDFNSYYSSKVTEEDQKRFGCVIAGETTAAFDPDTTCEEARDACIAEPADMTDEESSSCAVTEAIECDATVDEIRACAEAQTDQIAAYYSAYDCGSEAEFPVETPSACTSVLERCPSLFGGE